ncbi:MAG: hypothetical protein AAB557_03435 [Patescibacteria group bacterium]
MIDSQSLAILTGVIKKHLDTSQYRAFIFGSRTEHVHRKYCDVDIGILGPGKLPAVTLLQIQDTLRSSDIPYRTDVVDFGAVSQAFREKALSRTLSL